MKQQHEKINGYRTLSQEEIDLMNEGKELEKKCLAYLFKLEQVNDIDHRWLSIGKTDIQKGFMAAVRSVAKPL